MKALFIGLGSIGQRHLRNLRAIEGDNVECLAFRRHRKTPMLSDDMRVIEDSSLAAAYGVREFEDLDECLAERPDMAFITNPSSMHIDVARRCAAHGCALFIEKPLSDSLDGLDDLRSLCERNNLTTHVGFQLRFDAALRQIKAYLERNEIGTLISAVIYQAEYLPNWHPYEDYSASYAARRDLGGGVILTQIHELDYVCWLFGKPDAVTCVGSKRSDLKINVEDTATLLLRYGPPGRSWPVSICLDYLQRPPRRGCVVVGEEGRIAWDYHDNSVTLVRAVTGEVITHRYGVRQRNQLFVDQLRHFLDATRNRRQGLVPLAEGEISLRLALSARRSMEGGVTVDFDESTLNC